MAESSGQSSRTLRSTATATSADVSKKVQLFHRDIHQVAHPPGSSASSSKDQIVDWELSRFQREANKQGTGAVSHLEHLPRGLWLVRVPPEVDALWRKMPNNETVGRVDIECQEADKPATLVLSLQKDQAFAVEETDAGNRFRNSAKGKAFDRYKLITNQHQSSTPTTCMVLQADEQEEPLSKKYSMMGTIKKRLKAFPIRGKDYDKFLKEQESSNQELKDLIKLDRPVNNYKPVADHQNNIEFEKKKKLQQARKVRLEREEIAEKIFHAFESHQFYSFKDLVSVTDQSACYVKDILKDYCNYCTKGQHRFLWELKPEYRHYGDDHQSQS